MCKHVFYTLLHTFRHIFVFFHRFLTSQYLTQQLGQPLYPFPFTRWHSRYQITSKTDPKNVKNLDFSIIFFSIKMCVNMFFKHFYTLLGTFFVFFHRFLTSQYLTQPLDQPHVPSPLYQMSFPLPDDLTNRPKKC